MSEHGSFPKNNIHFSFFGGVHPSQCKKNKALKKKKKKKKKKLQQGDLVLPNIENFPNQTHLTESLCSFSYVYL